MRRAAVSLREKGARAVLIKGGHLGTMAKFGGRREALDLLLGTQGWRRFAEQDPGKFLQQNQQDEKARRDAEAFY